MGTSQQEDEAAQPRSEGRRGRTACMIRNEKFTKNFRKRFGFASKDGCRTRGADRALTYRFGSRRESWPPPGAAWRIRKS
jgi:hypothetical protein